MSIYIDLPTELWIRYMHTQYQSLFFFIIG